MIEYHQIMVGNLFSKTVKLILQKLGIKQCLGAVYHPQSQGIYEKINGVIKNCLIKFCQQTGLNWVKGLLRALMACRSSELHELRMTPFELAVGMTMPSLHASGKGLSLSQLKDDMKVYVKYKSNLQRSISAYVIQKQEQGEKEEHGVRQGVCESFPEKVI